LGQALKILSITERFITEYNRMKEAGKLPPNTELAELMKIKTPSTISNILKRKQNIQSQAWEHFRTAFRISEDPPIRNVGNGKADDLTTLLTQLMQKQNSLMELQNKILAEQKEDLIDKVKEIHVNSKSTIAYLQTILRVNRADDAVIMDNQDEQAGREAGSSARQAGNLEIAAAKDQKKKDKTRQDGAHR
jgi:hypothetical protein